MFVLTTYILPFELLCFHTERDSFPFESYLDELPEKLIWLLILTMSLGQKFCIWKKNTKRGMEDKGCPVFPEIRPTIRRLSSWKGPFLQSYLCLCRSQFLCSYQQDAYCTFFLQLCSKQLGRVPNKISSYSLLILASDPTPLLLVKWDSIDFLYT